MTRPTPFPARSFERAATVLVLLGALLRLRQYGFNRSLWYDEALLANQVITTTIGGFLDVVAAAPLGFLVSSRLAAQVFGNTDLALRIVPLLAGLATLLLASRLAASAFRRPPARLCLVGLVSFASPLVYYSSEFKPYVVDVAVTVGLWWLASCFDARRWKRDAAILAIAGSACIWISWSSVFVLAAVGLVLWLEQAIARHGKALAALTAAGLAWIASFGATYALALRTVTDNAWLEGYWAAGYAPSPLANPLWYRDSALGLVSIAFGPSGAVGIDAKAAWFSEPNVALSVLAAIGLACLARRSPRIACFVVGTAGATLVAAALQAYPFRGRLILFLVPVVFLALSALVERIADSNLALLRRSAALIVTAMFAFQLWTALPVAWKPTDTFDVKGALAAVQARRQAGDRIAISVWSRPAYEFYSSRFGLSDLPVATMIPASDSAAQLLRAIAAQPQTGRLWILFSHRFGERFHFFMMVNQHARRLDSWEGDRAGAFLYDFSSRAAPRIPPAVTSGERPAAPVR